MKKRIACAVAVATFALAACCFAGCTPSASSSDSSQEGAEAAVEQTAPTGQRTVEVELPANATTGYEWTYTMDPEGVLVEESSEYVAPEGDAVGTPGMQRYVFAAGADGDVMVEFSYARSWENETPDSTAAFQFKVADGLIESTGMVQNFSETLQEQA